MAKLLFTHSYLYRFDAKQWKNHQPYPPLATIQAAALLREQGHETALFDSNLIHSPREIIPDLDSKKPGYLIIYDDGFNYLTKMCLTNMREAAFEMIGLAKERNIRIIVSSSDSTDHYEKYLGKGADFIVLGEGEQTLSELITSLETGEQAPENIAGIAFQKQEEIVKTPPRSVMRDLDTLPFPAWDLIDMEAYRSHWVAHHGYFSLNLATTRGCPFKCNWCAKPIYGNRYNSRSPVRVAEEIEMLINRYQADHFWMCDDIFGLKPGWVQEFDREIKKRKLKFSYKIQSRADLLLQEDTIDALASSGLSEVWIGAESGSQKILDAMDKGTTVEQIGEATRLLKRKGVRICFFLQFGYLGESGEDIEKTIQMVLELMPDDIGISVSYPLPGTKFYDKVKNDLTGKANWEDSDDLDLMFRNTYPPRFYKKLHRFVHKKYRKKQGQEQLLRLLRDPSSLSIAKLRSFMLSAFYYTPSLVLDNIALKKLQKQS